MTGLLSAFELVRTFKGQSLANRIAFLERDAENKSRKELPALLAESAISSALMRSAIEVKRAASQIDEVVHAVGTLLALPDILEEGETIESLSLGAGNTGRSFDLETDRRVAEFTFIDWKGGPESIRKQKLFKDFYCLAESEPASAVWFMFWATTMRSGCSLFVPPARVCCGNSQICRPNWWRNMGPR